MTLSAAQYHERTRYDRRQMGGHGMDWANQPGVFKTYPGLETVPLAPTGEAPGAFLSELVRSATKTAQSAELTFDRLCRVIRSSHTITARARHGGGDFFYRSVASAGALYPFELYVAVRGVSGLGDGLYHHTLALDGLTRLRRGDVAGPVAEGLALEAMPSSAAVFFLSSIFFRSAWKYRDRAYRYNLLDTGHLTENVLMALVAHGLSGTLRYDFDDRKTNALLGVDAAKEGCLAVVVVQGRGGLSADKSEELEPVPAGMAEASRVSAREDGLDVIGDVHQSASTVSAPSGERSLDMLSHLGLDTSRRFSVSRAQRWPERMPYREALFHRRSKRNFVPLACPSEAFAGLLELLSARPWLGPGDGDWAGRGALAVGLLVGRVQGLDAGLYLLDPERGALVSAGRGMMTDGMAQICLDQAWLANGAFHMVLLSNLEWLERCWGPRGYRYAMLTAGRLGQRLYVGATAMGLGCCGIGAFFDGEAARLLEVNDETRLLYLVAAGPVKR